MGKGSSLFPHLAPTPFYSDIFPLLFSSQFLPFPRRASCPFP